MIPDCYCGNFLRGETERARGWCLDCIIRHALQQERVKQLLVAMHGTPWIPILQIVQQALCAEDTAMKLTSGTHEDPEKRAETFCLALQNLSKALSYGTKADAMCWHLLLHIEQGERAAWEELHDWCREHVERLYRLYSVFSISVAQYCYTSFFIRAKQHSLGYHVLTDQHSIAR